MTGSPPVLHEQDGHVVTLTLNRPETRNPLTDADVCEALAEACRRIAGDLSVRAVGPSRAAEMSFTAEPIDAATAAAWGLVSRTVPAAELMPEARRLAARIAANPPRQLRAAKRLLREGQTTRFDTLLELAAALQGAMHHTRDHEEAVRSLLEKRAASFVGE